MLYFYVDLRLIEDYTGDMNRELTKHGWLIIEDPLKPMEAYQRTERPISASIKRLSELTGKLPRERFNLKFNQGTIAGISCSRTQLLAISEDVVAFLNLEKRFTGTTSACITDNYGFTDDGGNRPALMQLVSRWQMEADA